MSILRAALVLAGWLVAASASAAPYIAQFADGARVPGKSLDNWHDRSANPSIGGRPLFAPGKEVRWIVDEEIPPAVSARGPYVELSGGDLLPGRVVGFSSGRTNGRVELPHLIVQPKVELQWQRPQPWTHARIVADFVERIVWRTGPARKLEPGTAFLNDGSRETFRSLRFDHDSVRLLRDEGIRDVPLRDIAELHMPAIDPWERYYRTLGALAPGGTGTLVQLETGDGLRLTSSLQRFFAAGAGGQPPSWIHAWQPAWSLDLFWLEFREIRSWKCFPANEPPLCLLEPSVVKQRSLAPGAWTPQRDRNVYSQRMRIGPSIYGSGLGVHANSILGFDLPAIATSFQTRLGLDAAAGSGGCVRARIHLGTSKDEEPNATPVFTSPTLIGSRDAMDAGKIPLVLQGPRRLWLVVDAAHDNRPPGSDPLDVRDDFNWIDSVVELDPVALRSEVTRRLRRWVPAWEGWTLVGGSETAIELANRLDMTEPDRGRFVLDVLPRDRLLTLSRTLQIGPEDRWLLANVSRPGDPSKLQFSIDGRVTWTWDVPPKPGRADPSPSLLALSPTRGKEVTLQVTQLPGGPQSQVSWHALNVVRNAPLRVVLFADDPKLLAGENAAKVRLSEDRLEGIRSISLTPKMSLKREGLSIPIRVEPQLGEYRYLRLAWKQRGGGHIAFQLMAGSDASNGDRGLARTLRYEAGPKSPTTPGAMRIDQILPQEWTIVTRDLAQDLGNVTLSGIELYSEDGEETLFDDIQVARHPWEFEDLATVAVDGPAQNQLAGVLARGFMTSGSIGGLAVVREFRGRPYVLRSLPPAPNVPFSFTRQLTLPPALKSRLLLTVGHEEQKSWKLTVKAADKVLRTETIGPETARQGWLELEVPLDGLEGKPVPLIIEQMPLDPMKPAYAYWSRVEIVSD